MLLPAAFALGSLAARPVEAQEVASASMSVRVTVFEPVHPIALSDPAQPPSLARNPTTGELTLRIAVTSLEPIEATVRPLAGDVAPGRPVSVRRLGASWPADSASTSWLIELADFAHSPPLGFEVRMTSRTGDAETTAIAIVSQAALVQAAANRPSIPRQVAGSRSVAAPGLRE